MRQRCPILLSLALISGFLFPSIILAHTRSPSSRWPVVAAQDDKDVRALVRDHRVERSLESKQLHVYRIPAAVGHFLSIAVEQPDTDVVVALFAPDGAKVFQTTSADFRLNRTRVYAIANQVGDYRMEVRAFDQGAPAGRYSITLDALRQATATDKSRVAARGFLEKANSEWRWGNPETFRKAVESYVEALALWRAVEDKNGEADTLAFLSHAYRNLGDYPNAVQSAEAALHVSKAIGDHTGEAWATALLAEAFAGMGQVDKQLEYFYKTLHIHHNAGNKRGEASALLGLGQYHLGSADYQKALEFIAQSLSLSRSINNRPREARALFNLGLAYWLIGDYQESLEAYRQCLPYYQAVGDVVQAMSILDNMGLVYYALGEYQKALDCYAQTLADRRSRNQHSAVADTLTGIGTVYAAMGQNQQALENLNQALTIYREVGNRTGVPYALRNIASVYISLKDPGKALDYFNEALPEDRALRDQPAEIKALSGLAMAHRDLGNLNKARTYIEEALDIVESLRSRLTSQELRAAFFASKWSYYQFYIDLLMRLNQQKPDAKFDAAALQASERARARSLLDLLAEAKVDLSEGIDPALKQKEKEIQGRITRANGQLIQALSASPVNKDLVAQLNEELKQTENSREQLEVQIRKAHPKYAELKYPTPLKLEAIQDLLDEHTALLEYSLGQDRSFLFVVSKQGLKSYALPPAAEINKLVQEVRSTVERPGRREFGSFVSRSRKLYDVLIAPATNELKEKRNLLIAPDGALYYLPFEALLTGLPQSEQGEMSYLLKRWGVSYVPSASVLANLRQSQKQAEKKPGRREFVAFADPAYSNLQQKRPAESRVAQVMRSIFEQEGGLNLQPLKDSSREVAGIARFYRPDQTSVYLGDAAKEESVKSNEYLASARQVHFATHGLISERTPQHSGLVLTLDEDLTEDGLLQVYEIFNLKLNADLVVLSACRTGLGKEVRGEGVIGLTRAFLYAGASSLTVSLWQVADQSTSDLMIHFYEQMNAGHGKTEALRRAKLKMIEEKRYTHPFYWAPFVLIGEP